MKRKLTKEHKQASNKKTYPLRFHTEVHETGKECMTKTWVQKPGYHNVLSRKECMTNTWVQKPGYHNVLSRKECMTMSWVQKSGYHNVLSRK